MAEGKEHALAIGKTTMSSEDMWVMIFFKNLLNISFNLFYFRSKVNKGIGVENIHYLNDGLWQMKPVK